MKVSIKDFSINMDVKTNGIEFEIKDTKGKHLGDCYITKTGLIWCEGRVTRENGKTIKWPEFIKLVNGRP